MGKFDLRRLPNGISANVESIYEGMAFICFSFIYFLLRIKDILFGCSEKAMLL